MSEYPAPKRRQCPLSPGNENPYGFERRCGREQIIALHGLIFSFGSQVAGAESGPVILLPDMNTICFEA